MVVVVNYEPRGTEGVFGAPLIEFHQVRIHPHQDIDQPLQIYGTIKVTNSVGRISHLYNQPEDDNETVYVYAGDIISLRDMHPELLPFPLTTVYVKLVDKTNQLVLADDTLILDYMEKRMTFEEDGNVNVIGKDGFVNLHFTTFDVGVIAFSNFTLYKKNDLDQCRDDDGIDVLETISVSRESEYSFAEDFKSQLLRLEVEDDPLPVTFGESIPLAKCRMVVPPYSSILITVSFRDN